MSEAPQGHGRRAAFRAPFLMFVVMGLAGCSADTTTDPAGRVSPAGHRSVTVSPDAATRTIGQSVHFQAVVQDHQGDEIGASLVVWRSSDTTVVVVDSAGDATTRGVGSAIIFALTAGALDSATVTVVAPPVSSVDVTPAMAHATVGDTSRFAAVMKDKSGNILSGRDASWLSSDTNVATLSLSGLARAVGAGVVTISATSDDKVGQTTLTVSDSFVPVARVAIVPATANVVVGDSIRLGATVSDANGKALANRSVTWSSGSPAIATVGASGLARAVQPGSATITAISEGQSGRATLTVTAVPVASVQVQPSTLSMVVGDSARLTATAKDANNQTLTGRQITWLSGNPGVAAVSATGTTRAVQVGSTTITATSEGKTGQTSISVSSPPPPVGSVSVTPAGASLLVGTTQQLAAVVKDSSGNSLTGQAVTWSSSDNAVVTVSASGLARAVRAGSATVTGAAGGKSGGSVITAAFGPPASVSVSPGGVALGVGQVQQLSAFVRDAAGNILTGQPVAWATSAPLVATVVGGLVTALVPGSATVTATSGTLSSTANATVTLLPPPSPFAGWPNAPGSFGLISDQSFAGVNDLGWSLIWNDAGLGSLISDGAAPLSPPGVLQIKYPTGLSGGTAPATEERGLNNVRHFYSGMWWKPSADWQGHVSNVNKIQFVFDGAGGDIYMAMYGPPGGPYQLVNSMQVREHPEEGWLLPNVGDGRITLGQWHQIEWLIDYDASTIKFWLDGNLVGNYTNLQFSAQPLTDFKISPTWGGLGDAKQHDDYYWFDHILITGY